MTEDEASQGEKMLGIDGLEISFDAPVIASIELPEAGGIAAAAGVLEKKRVVESERSARPR